MGTAPERAGERHLYRIPVPKETTSWPEQPLCLTCSADGLSELIHSEVDLFKNEVGRQVTAKR